MSGASPFRNRDEKQSPVLRQRPDMASMRLLVLKFVREYIGKWGGSPSYGEIAAALDISRTRVKRSLNSLAGDGLLLRVKGPRGLSLPDDEQAAIDQLRRLGWEIDARGHVIRLSQNGTKKTLLPPPELDYPGGHPAGDPPLGPAERDRRSKSVSDKAGTGVPSHLAAENRETKT